MLIYFLNTLEKQVKFRKTIEKHISVCSSFSPSQKFSKIAPKISFEQTEIHALAYTYKDVDLFAEKFHFRSKDIREKFFCVHKFIHNLHINQGKYKFNMLLLIQ